MAGITRRRDELAVIVGHLESDEYETAEDLAYAVLQASAEIIAGRELFAVVSREYPDVAWGPYYTHTEAQEGWSNAIGHAIGGKGGFIIPLRPWRPSPETEASTHQVCQCGHPKYKHVVNRRGQPTDCGVVKKKEKCPCPQYVRS